MIRKILIFSFLCLSFLSAKEDYDDLDILVLPNKTVIEGDYFAYGKSIEISGTVKGDLYVFGAQVYIDGVVEGDVLAIAGSVNITGTVHGDVRVLSGQAMLSGLVDGNVTICVGNGELFPTAEIKGSVVVLAGNIDIGAHVGKNVRVYASNLRVSDCIQGNLLAYVGQMRLSSKASIGGKVEYWSNNLAHIAKEVTVAKGITHHPSFFYQLFHGKIFKGLRIGSKFAAFVMNFFYTLVIALIFMRFFPQNIERSLAVLSNRPLQALICGIIVLILLPIAAIVLLASILGAPFALTLIAINVIGFYTVKIISILWIARFTFQKLDFSRHRKLYFILSLMVYYGLILIPYFGWVVTITALLFGLGAVVLGRMPNNKKIQES